MTAHYRSMLFVSGEKPERFPKAMAAGADLVCIDLEDAVAAENKALARKAVLEFAAQLSSSGSALAIRINGLKTQEGLKDVLALMESQVHVNAVLLPKVESAQEIQLFHAWAGGCSDHLVALIESPLGIERAASIASARSSAPTLSALMLGGADLSAELGAEFAWEPLLWSRSRLVQAARMAGLQAWDVPHIDVRDLDALADETRRSATLGFDCKTAIHPTQIPVIHAALAPDAEQARWAIALLDAFTHRSQSASAFMFEGRMVDAPVLAKARQIVQRACVSPTN